MNQVRICRRRPLLTRLLSLVILCLLAETLLTAQVSITSSTGSSGVQMTNGAGVGASPTQVSIWADSGSFRGIINNGGFGTAGATPIALWPCTSSLNVGGIVYGISTMTNYQQEACLQGNNSGTVLLSESATGVPSWKATTGSGSAVLATSPSLASPTFTGTVTFPDGTTNASAGWTFGTALNLPSGSSLNGTPFGTGATATIANYLALAGGTMTGKLNTVASASGGAGFNLAPGSAPSSPNNGDAWLTSTGLFARINGGTVGFTAAGSPSACSNAVVTGFTLNTASAPTSNCTSLTSAYLPLSSMGTITGGTWNGTAIANTNGGTGQNTSSSTGVAQVSSGTWSVSTALANGTTGTAQAIGDTSNDVATNSFISQGILTNASAYTNGTTTGSPIVTSGTLAVNTFIYFRCVGQYSFTTASEKAEFGITASQTPQTIFYNVNITSSTSASTQLFATANANSTLLAAPIAAQTPLGTLYTFSVEGGLLVNNTTGGTFALIGATNNSSGTLAIAQNSAVCKLN